MRYVPKGTKAAYESTNIWKNFWNIREFSDEGTGINNYLIESADNSPLYNLMGERVNSIIKGKLYIKNGKKYINHSYLSLQEHQ